MSTDYDAVAKEYKRSKLAPWRTYMERYSLLKLLGKVRGKSVLDLACGEGFYSRLVRERGAARVVGVDLSSGMIGLGRLLPQPRCARTSVGGRGPAGHRMA